MRLWTQYALISALLVYLSLSLIFNGAGNEGRISHALMQGIAALGIAALALTWPDNLKLTPIKPPIVALLALVSIGLFQCIPVPARIWQVVPGRSILIDNFHSLDIPIGMMALSLDGDATVATLGYVLPPLFVLLLCLRISLRQLKSVVPWFMLIATSASVFLGIAQVVLGKTSGLYLYDRSSFDLPVGTFANVNHFASFILLTLPFMFLLLRGVRSTFYQSDREIAEFVAISCALLVAVFGIISAGSLAIYLLAAPAVAASLLAIKKPARKRSQLLKQSGVLAIFIIAVMFVTTSPLLYGLGAVDIKDGELSRLDTWSITIAAIQDHWPVGSGIGTYLSVIPMYENPDTITSTYIARAHNDYLQLVMEAGFFGVCIIVLGLSWLGIKTWTVWRQQSYSSVVAFKRMASIALLVICVHSIVDFPLRTPAIAVFVALCVAIVAKDTRSHLEIDVKKPTNPKRVVL